MEKLNPGRFLIRMNWRFRQLITILLLRMLAPKQIAHNPATTKIVVETIEEENSTLSPTGK